MLEHRTDRLPVSVSVALFIEDEDGRLLLGKQNDQKGGQWGPIAGGIYPHEDPLMAARREALEEIGAQVKLTSLIGIRTVSRGDDRSGMAFWFRARLRGEIELDQGPDAEIVETRYFTELELEELIAKDMIYKPEYSVDGIRQWRSKITYSLECVLPLLSWKI